MDILKLISSTQNSMGSIVPEMVLLIGFVLALVFDLFSKNKNSIFVIGLLTLVSNLILCIIRLKNDLPDVDYKLFNDFLWVDTTGLVFTVIISAISVITYIPFLVKKEQYEWKPEVFYLLPILTLSAQFMIFSNHLLMMYLSVEFVSIVSYIFIAYDIKNQESAESSVKYILFGVLASALMIYGLSLLYSISNELNFNSSFLSNLSKAGADAVILPMVLFLAGFFYKISAFPMHYYVPDVYEGTKPKMLAIISTIPKIAGVALLLNLTKVFSFEYHNTTLVWPSFPFAELIAWIAIATLFVANLSAISQKNIKRIFAYSSISHTGFILMGIASFSTVGESSLLFYTIIFAISNVAVFFIIEQLEQNYNIKTLDDLRGYFTNHALSSVLIVMLMASLIGLPPFAGFIAKFYVFSAVFEQYVQLQNNVFLYLLIAGAINTVVSLFYYFNIVKAIFLSRENALPRKKTSLVISALIFVFVWMLLILGIFPNYLI